MKRGQKLYKSASAKTGSTNAPHQLRLSDLADILDMWLQGVASPQLNHAEFQQLILQDGLLLGQERQLANKQVSTTA